MPSRREVLKGQGIDEPEMPICDAAYLLEYLFEIGPVLHDGMGSSPLTHLEIAAWQSNTGILLDSWEARYLRQLSLDYMIESQKATDPEYPAPYHRKQYNKMRTGMIAVDLREAMRALNKM